MNSKTLDYMVGADPESFLIAADGTFVSSIDRIGGSKEFPRPIDEEGCAVQEDNVAVEWNIPACNTVENFIHYNRKVIQYLSEHVAQQGLSLKIIPSARFSKEQLKDPRAKQFGCEPDYNAWKGGSMNPRPNSKDKSLRSAGGHIHLGIKDLDPLLLIKAMDLFCGVGMLQYDDDTERRQLYGKPGAYRIKPYGVEYRTLSNAWLQSDETIRYVWRQQERAVEFVRSGKAAEQLADGNELSEMVQECILTGDKGLFEYLAKEFDL